MTHPSLSPTPIDWCDAALMIAYPVGVFLIGFVLGMWVL